MSTDNLSKLKTYTAEELLATRFRPREPVIEPWLRTEETAVIWAPSGVGKTLLCLSLALAVAGGGTVADWTAPKARKVLYIDGEMNQQDIRDRIEMLVSSGAVELPDPKIALRNLEIIARQAQEVGTEFFDITEEETQNGILKRARAGDVELIILDNFTTLSDSLEDENASSEFKRVQDFFLQMKRAGIATILVHHANKGGKGMRGSTALETTFEVILGLQRPKVVAPGEACFHTNFTKFRGKGDHRLESRKWTLGDKGWEVSDSEPDNPEEDPVYIALKTLDFVNQNEIAEKLGINKGTVSRRLSKLKEQGVLKDREVDEAFQSAKKLRDEKLYADVDEEF
ncbi:AAA family ATPase [Thioclava sp. 15-R06ZXC-3]|uniref:AAA family ATPase n=1 Tax=Thioclava arctica TaxID=3238301 RepID=A0ABV3TKU8_9RHOB